MISFYLNRLNKAVFLVFGRLFVKIWYQYKKKHVFKPFMGVLYIVYDISHNQIYSSSENVLRNGLNKGFERVF